MLHAARCAWNIGILCLEYCCLRTRPQTDWKRVGLGFVSRIAVHLASWLDCRVCLWFVDGKRKEDDPLPVRPHITCPERSAPRFRDSAVRLSQRVCTVCLFLLDTEFFSPSFSFLSSSFFHTTLTSAFFNLFSTAFDEELFIVESITTKPFNAFRSHRFVSAL